MNFIQYSDDENEKRDQKSTKRRHAQVHLSLNVFYNYYKLRHLIVEFLKLGSEINEL